MIDVTRAYGLTFSIPANDVGISLLLRNSGEFARVESDLIIDYMRAAGGGTYIDVGGNIGTIALPVAAASSDNRVIAVEAQRFLAMLLSANAVQNNLANMSVIHAAAGAEAGLVAFPQTDPALRERQTNYGIIGLGVSGLESLPTENVRACTLDEIAPANTRFVKLDVEGFEAEVLAGADRLIDDIRPCWLIETNNRTSAAAHLCMRRLRAANYRLFWFYAPFVTPNAERETGQSWLGDLNFLAVPVEIDRNPWSLTEIEGEAPDLQVRKDCFQYLINYGFRRDDSGPATAQGT